MILELERQHGTNAFTRGTLKIDGVVYCDTLEDMERPEKIAGKTAIPTGKYRVIINQSVRFKRKMPLLVNVPKFEGVRIHAGNTAEHTEGCILVGKWFSQGYITNSKDTFNDLFKKLSDAFNHHQDIWIEII